MDVFFETRMGKPFCIEIGYFDTVFEIKEKIRKYQGIPIARQTLMFNGHCLEDGRDVEYCEILHNSRIQLHVAPDSTQKFKDSSPKSSKIQLLLKMSASRKQVEMDADDTILQVKEKISEFEGVPANTKILLFFHGIELLDNQTLSQCELVDNSEIDVIIKPSQNNNVTASLSPVTQATSSGGNSNSKKLKIVVITQCGTNKVPVEINASDNVGELRRELQKLQEIFHFNLPPEGYFFIYKQNVMDDDRSFRWHHVVNGDTIEIFNGSVTGGSS